MRPPHECGGKHQVWACFGSIQAGFNEAPARMRGKTLTYLMLGV